MRAPIASKPPNRRTAVDVDDDDVVDRANRSTTINLHRICSTTIMIVVISVVVVVVMVVGKV
jgi:t-SNARE complex subunit (syntaxin)